MQRGHFQQGNQSILLVPVVYKSPVLVDSRMMRISKNQVKRAGRVLIDENATDADRAAARNVADAWRAAHKVPLNQMESALRQVVAKVIDSLQDVFIASRIKRLDSIEGKPKRPGLNINLNQMNDIAGCRVVLPDVDDVMAVVDALVKSRIFVEDPVVKDYINAPHPLGDGYRGVHVIAKFDAPDLGLTGLYCEAQIRTRRQHAWSTAVETYDVSCGDTLKFGHGDADVGRFFLLASELFAQKEGTPSVLPSVPPLSEIKAELLLLEKRTHIEEKLKACSGSVAIVGFEDFSDAAYVVLDMDYELQCSRLHVFSEDQAEQAEQLLFNFEQKRVERGPLRDALLVKVTSLNNLRRAYPNYLADVSYFINDLHELLIRVG